MAEELVAHYAIRALMHQVALHQQFDPDRLSFVHALEVVRNAIADFQMTARHLLVELLQRLWRDLVRYLLLKRRNRINPHVVKRKMSKFHLRRLEHARSPQPTIPFREAVVLI
ncbi:MAG: hypothetical protein KGS73_18270 [Chloroflexi bacterium]|nr:hypothetical protein [Chloroflexota bacterium]